MKQPIRLTVFKSIALLLLFTGALPACKKEEKKETVQPLVKLATNATLGNYLTDKDGNTLYYFANDPAGTSTCAGGCLAVWPMFYAGDNLTANLLASGLDVADFGVTTSTAGQKQTTYKGWPLYYYAPAAAGGTNTRETPGEVKGEGVGGVWFVGKPDYTINLVNAQLVGHDGKNYKSDMTEGTGKTLYFTDDRGRTLYTFVKDSAQKNKFTNSTFSNNNVWPIYETDKVVVPSTLDKTLFSATTVFGKKQLTYKGWPLYYFGQDGGVRGSNKGVSFPAPGVWPVAMKDINPAP